MATAISAAPTRVCRRLPRVPRALAAQPPRGQCDAKAVLRHSADDAQYHLDHRAVHRNQNGRELPRLAHRAVLRPSIRLRLALRHAGLAQAFVDALKFRVEGRIVAQVHSWQGLQREAGPQLLHLGGGLFRLLVVAQPSVGGGEHDEGPRSLIAARDRLVAPFDRLFPARAMGVKVAYETIATTSRSDRGGSGAGRFLRPRSRPRRGRR
jgi:hypothetical protein